VDLFGFEMLADLGTALSQPRNPDPVFSSGLYCGFVSGVNMPGNSNSRIIGKDAPKPAFCEV
jgi:hypothetical protein